MIFFLFFSTYYKLCIIKLIEKNGKFNYYLLCSSHEPQGKNVKGQLDKYSNDDNCLLTVKEKKEFSFLCVKCCIISSINFDIAANKEKIQLLKTGKKLEEENMNLAKELK